MNVLALLDYVQEEVEHANKVPFSEDARVDRDKLLNLIEDVRTALPTALMEAETVLNQRDQIKEDAKREGERIIAEAREQAKQLVEETVITQEAYAHAQEVIDRAQAGAREVRRSANEYVEDVLAEMETYISRNLEMVRQNRDSMRGR